MHHVHVLPGRTAPGSIIDDAAAVLSFDYRHQTGIEATPALEEQPTIRKATIERADHVG